MIVVALMALAGLASACSAGASQPTATPVSTEAVPSPTYTASVTKAALPTGTLVEASATPSPHSEWISYSNERLGFQFQYPLSYVLENASEGEYGLDDMAYFGYPQGTRHLNLRFRGPVGQSLILVVNGGPYGLETSYLLRSDEFAVGPINVLKRFMFTSSAEPPVTPSPTDWHLVVYEYKTEDAYFTWFARMMGPDADTERIFDQIIASFRSDP